MNKLVKRIVNIVVTVVSLIATVAILHHATSKNATSNSPTLELSFFITYGLGLVAILAIAAFSVISIIGDKKQLINVAIISAIGIVNVILGYVLASPELSDTAIRLELTARTYLLCGIMLNFAYITFVEFIIAFLGTIIFVKIKER